MGAEKIQMTFQHGFGTNPSLDTEINGEAKNWRGSSSLDKHNRNRAQKKIHTTVYKDCPPGVSFENEQNSFDKCKRVKAFKPGELVSFSVEEWLDIAGTSLDKRVSPSAVPKDQTSAIYPTRRSVGTNLQIILTYEGRTDLSGEFRCAVTVVTPSESWGSAGHIVTYNTQRGAGSSEVTEDYVDTFYRGVKFDFTSQGNIKRFDFFVAGSYLLSTLLVIINIIPAVLKFAAFYWPNDIKAPVYRHASEEMFSFNTALADFSAGAAMASQFASTFPVNADGRVSRTTFESILAERLSPFTAGAITDCIFTHLAQMNHRANDEKVLTVTDVVTIGPSSSNIKVHRCSFPANTIITVMPGAGDQGKRMNTDCKRAPDSFKFMVDGNKITTKRTDSNSGWGMNLQIMCKKALTVQVVDGPKVTDEAVTQNELMRLFASNTVNMEDLLKHSFSKMEGFPSLELMNLEEIRALAAVKNVTVLEDDGKDANALGPVEQRKLKDFYVTALTSAFSLPTVKNLPADSSLDLEPGQADGERKTDIEQKSKNVKVRVPVGAMEGDVMRFTLPSGVESTVIIPAGAKVGDLIRAEPPAGTSCDGYTL